MWRDLILAWAKSLVGTYYHVVRIGADGAGGGPVVAVSNHTNGLVDGVVLIEATDRPLKFLAKQELMRMPVLGWLARGSGAVPVYRKKDNVPTSWNDGVFDAIHKALGDGAAVGVFPEGTSHLDAGIRPLKTGAARIALGAEESNAWRLGVRVVPVGIHYEARDSMGSRVLTIVGEPVTVASYRGGHRAAPWDTALELTGEIHQALETVRIELKEEDAAPLIGLVLDEVADGRLKRAAAPAALRALVDGWRTWSSEDESAARAALTSLADQDRRRRAGGAWGATVLALRVLAGILWFVPLGLSQLLRRSLPLPVDKCATVLLLAGTVFFPVWLLALSWWIGSAFGAAWGWVAGAVLVASAWAAWWASRRSRARAFPAAVAEERARVASELRARDQK